MLKNIFQKFWSLRVEFTRYFLIGISGVVLDMATLWFFVDHLHWGAIQALMVNQLIVISYIFNLNKRWAFKSGGQTTKEVQRYFFVYLFNYLFAIAWMWLWHSHFGFEPKIVRLANIILSVSWNFLLYKYFVYKDKAVPVNNLAV